MEGWMWVSSRWQHGNDPHVDDESTDGVTRNHRSVCMAIDFLTSSMPYVHTRCTSGVKELSGAEIVDINAAFYRHEMHDRPTPSCLAVDCTIATEHNELRDVLDADAMRLDRSVFTLDHLTDGVMQLLGDFDHKTLTMSEYHATDDTDLPRDRFATSTTVYGRSSSRWRCPIKGGGKGSGASQASVYTDGAYAHYLGGCFNERPRSDFEDRAASTREARERMISVICWFRRHSRPLTRNVLLAMRERAMRSASLYMTAERMRRASRVVARERALLAQDSLTSIVTHGPSEELGDALWPYFPPEAGSRLMACSKALYSWGTRFNRGMHIRLMSEKGNTWSCEAHRMENDGSITMQRNRWIRVRPVFEHTFMTNVETGVEEGSFTHPKHGSCIDADLSTTRALLIFDDDGTEVPYFGKSALGRKANGRDVDGGVSHFPGKMLPTLLLSAKRLSSDFGKTRDTKFRIVIEVNLVTKGYTEVTTYTAKTAPFRVVARIESEKAAAGTKERQMVRKLAISEQARKVKK